MTTTALFGGVERFGLLWVQIVALEVDVDVDVAVDYIELVVPVILSQKVVHMCCAQIGLKNIEYAVLEEDIGRNFADFESENLQEHSNIVRFGTESFADNGESGLGKTVHGYLELLTQSTENNSADTAVEFRRSVVSWTQVGS